MRSLRWAGLVFSLLIVGVLGGMMAAHPAEAATPTSKPKLMVNGVAVNLTYNGTNCTPNDGYLLGVGVKGCWSVDGTSGTNTIVVGPTGNQFRIGSVSSTNPARVIFNDHNTVSPDRGKLTGITFQSTRNIATTGVSTSSSAASASADGTPCLGTNSLTNTDDCHVGVITLINTFDNPGGENAGDPNLTDGTLYPYKLATNIGAMFQAPGGQTNKEYRIRLIGTVCNTWTAHLANGFGCDVDNTSTTFTRAGTPGTGGQRVGIGNFQSGTSYLHSGVFTSGTLTYITQPNPVPTITPSILTSCRTNVSAGNVSQCMPTVRLDYIIWVRGTGKVMEQASPGSCGGSCNTVEAVTSPPKKAVLFCGNSPDDVGSLMELCFNTINSNVTNAKNAAIADGAVEAQTCSGACIIIQVDGTPPASAEDTEVTFTASGQGLPTDPFTIKLDSFISGVLGEGLMTFSDLEPDPDEVRTFIYTGSSANFQLDQVVCTGPAICKVLYDGSGNSKTKIGFTVTGLSAPTGRLLADLHVH